MTEYYHKKVFFYGRLWLLGLTMLCIVMVILSLCAGEQWIMPVHWFDQDAQLFIWQLRLPRTMAVLLTGSALAISGVVLQALFDNPLAEPGLLGVSNGAGVGLVCSVLFAIGNAGLSAIVGALIVTLILLYFSRYIFSNQKLLLAGIALGMIGSSIMTWSVYFSSNLDLRQLLYWMMGSFSGISWHYVWMMIALLPVIIWLLCQGKILNLLSLGEVSAWQLGISLSLWRCLLVAAIGWLVGISVALAGVIGFVGLIVPHLLRMLGLFDHRFLLPASALAGGIVLLIADIISRLLLTSAELPVGIVTVTIGTPLFIWVLFKQTR